jgi:hypothetical protein
MTLVKNALLLRGERVLPFIIEKADCKYTQIIKGEKCYLYEHKITDGKTGYEVFLIKIQPPTLFPSGNLLPARERWPNENAFGVWAFYCTTLHRATEKFIELEGTTDEQ